MIDIGSSEVNELVSNGVLDEAEGREVLSVSREFERSRNELAASDPSPGTFDRQLEKFYDMSMYKQNDYSHDDEVEVVANLQTLRRFCDETDDDKLTKFAVILDIIKNSSKEESIPEGFLQLPGDQIERYLAVYSDAILFFWTEDSSSCISLSEEFSQLVRTGSIPPDIGLIAIFAPEHANLIKENYDVGIAPTTIFCKEGAPELRFIGCKSSEEILNYIGRAYA